MSKTIEATFDGEVIRPDEPLELRPNTRLRITIESSTSPKTRPQSFLQTARSLHLEGPTDWSERIEKYLYGNHTDAQN